MPAPSKDNNRVSFILRKLRSLIDWRMGAISGVIMGLIVFTINVQASSPVDFLASTSAGVKQAVYTLFIGGFLQQISNWFAFRPWSAVIAIVLSALVPGSIASSLVYFMHRLSGTPEPFLSTIPIIILSILIFPLIAAINRKRHSHLIGSRLSEFSN